MRILVAPVKKDASCGDSGSDDDYGRGDDDAADGGVASDCSTSSSSIMPPVTSFDRHLVLIGCQTFQAFFDRHPQFLSNFDKFNAIEIDGVLVSSALKMHTSRVLAVVEDIVENTGNPEKIRNLLQELGRHHYKQVSNYYLRYITKVSFFLQCSKMQLITSKKFNIKTCFIQFLWFFRLKC